MYPKSWTRKWTIIGVHISEGAYNLGKWALKVPKRAKYPLGVLLGCKSIFLNDKNVKKRAFCALFCVYFKRFYSKFQIFFVFPNNFYLKFILFLYFFWLANDLIFIEKKPYPFVRVPIFICIYYRRLLKYDNRFCEGYTLFIYKNSQPCFYLSPPLFVAKFSEKSISFLKFLQKKKWP